MILSKTLDPADLLGPLAPALVDVDAIPLGNQHPMRRWEYALALTAIPRTLQPQRVLEVGGAGSPFAAILRALGHSVTEIDPKLNMDLATYRASTPPGDAEHAIVTCLSVFEHVERPITFLQDLAACVAPGGVLILTFDYHPSMALDACHFSWMRQRIVTLPMWRQMAQVLRAQHLSIFGGWDRAFYGPQVYDYTFASLVMQKREQG